MNRIRKITTWQWILFLTLALCCIGSIAFVNQNHSFYDRPIAQVIDTIIEEETDVTDMHGNEDTLFVQKIVAKIMNGEEKGREVQLVNEYSSSGAYDQQYRIGNEVFVSIDSNAGEQLMGSVTDVKRDKYVLIVAWIFVFTLLIVGHKQGLLAIVGFVINVMVLSFALDIYVKYYEVSLLVICGICILLFTTISLLLVSGRTEKTYAAIVATLVATVVSLSITSLVIWITSGNGLRYEEMQFLTRPYHTIFMAGLFIGSLGAIMDVAITMSSSMFALYERDHTISVKALRASGIDIGKDIMGTITSILFFAYISGSIPMLILYLKNASPVGFALSMNLSLELARALAGGIGIVLTIPIGLYTAIFFIERKRARI
ncbi:yibE/F-like family protein [Sporosarcina sp. P20a]|uniref:YibE/F family protein n=1 Tax=Sporosarcina sp. P20a TaxID=2048256 RepID=UPI000C17299D|nr:YibE/F family protein [Sporosarcina sp. P20a]PIC86260.1 yibE/F-like family protein [Sporosarcina sp. P20a]